jgi:hypothetical protein
MKNHITYTFIVFHLCVLLSCNNEPLPSSKNNPPTNNTGSIIARDTSKYSPSSEWEKYWYAGKAEISTYFLKQSRYGEIHDGNLTNIFVTEDFSPALQVKLDDPDKAGSGKIKVLKLNQAVKFVTGIYPYSMMLSCFSPVDINKLPHAIKISASSQEWCGNSFFQLNNRNNQYHIEQRSYFEKEGDRDLSLSPLILEDELWNIIRIDPTRLPQGEHDLLPGALYLRLSHKPVAPVKAALKLNSAGSNFIFSLSYPSLQRNLNITIAKTFPYQLLGWSDSFPGIDAKLLTTTAVLNKTMVTDYWVRHTNADRKLRAELGLPVDTQ